MSDAVTTDAIGELPGFFGAEQARSTEEIDPGIWTKIDDYLERNPGGQERLIPILHMVQQDLGYLPFTVQEYVAEKLGLSPIELFGVVSFYHFFTTTPRGKYQLKMCMGTACFVRHAQRLIETVRETIGAEIGGVTDDRLFSVEQVRCLGCCSLAPAVMMNSETMGKLTPKNVRKLLLDLKSRAREDPSEASSV